MSDFIKLIPTGEENAIKLSDIMALTGLDRRDAYKIVEGLRKQGTVICATNNGYFLPSNVMELECYIKRAGARIKAESVVLSPAKKLLKEWRLNAEFASLSRLDDFGGGADE